MAVNPEIRTEAAKAASPPKLEVRAVSKFYQGRARTTEALRDVSLTIDKNEFLVIVGPSGCGKSTLLSLIAGFDKPTSGGITLDGRPVSRPGPDRLMMFQEHALFPWLNVIDNVSFGLRSNSGYSSRKYRRISRSFLRTVHLAGFEKSQIHELSGGMRHRVALARSLAPDPRILLIDEPFQALDTLTKFHLYDELQEIFVSTEKTIIMVTHDSLEAACLGDRIVVFSSRPGSVRTEIKIDLPRPRSATDPKVVQLAGRITEQLEIHR